jgi:hypothetical protein
MEVMLGFLAFAFIAGIRGAERQTRSPRRAVLFLASLVVTVALLSHRVA